MTLYISDGNQGRSWSSSQSARNHLTILSTTQGASKLSHPISQLTENTHFNVFVVNRSFILMINKLNCRKSWKPESCVWNKDLVGGKGKGNRNGKKLEDLTVRNHWILNLFHLLFVYPHQILNLNIAQLYTNPILSRKPIFCLKPKHTHSG